MKQPGRPSPYGIAAHQIEVDHRSGSHYPPCAVHRSSSESSFLAGAKTGHFSALPLSNITPKYRIFTPYPFHRRSNSAKIA